MKTIAQQTERIKSFWKWFIAHRNDFGEKFENEKLINELDEIILNSYLQSLFQPTKKFPLPYQPIVRMQYPMILIWQI